MSPRVSVVMAAYNSSRFIERAIQSTLDQSMQDLELIVIDDCSTDQTFDIVQNFAKEDPRVRLHRLEQNGGPGAARYRGVKEAKGDWIAVHDSDDRMLPNRLEKLLAVAEENSFDVIADNLYYVNEDTDERFGSGLPLTDRGRIRNITPEEFVLANLPGESGFKLGFLKPIIRRSFLSENGINYQEDLRVAEDYQFLFDILVSGARFGFINECYYDYLIRPDSVSHTYSEKQLLQIADMSRENLKDPRVQANPTVLAAVEQRQKYCDRNAAYVRVLGRVREKRPIGLLAIMAQEFGYLPYVLWRGARVLRDGRVWGSGKEEVSKSKSGTSLDDAEQPSPSP